MNRISGVLTEEDEAQFVPLNIVAFELACEGAERENVVPTCWLCLTPEERARWVMVAVLLYGPDVGRIAADQPNCMQFLTAWRDRERRLKAIRESGSPAAGLARYFFEYL